MQLIQTEKRHWINGYQTRANGNFKTLALSLGNCAIMLCFGSCFCYFNNQGIKKVKPTLYFYKLN